MWAKILLLFFVFSFLFRTDTSFDQDLGRHLKLGEIIWQTKRIPLTNYFSYTYPDFPFINSHWLFEVLVYLGQQTIGLTAILVLKIAIFLLSIWLILKIVPKNNLLLLPIGFIFLHTLRERPELRPEIFSFLFAALTIYSLDKYERTKTRLIYLLPLVQLIWVNTHIYFIVGLILQAIYLIHLTCQSLRFHPKGGRLRLLVFTFVLSIISSLINPSGLKGFLNPFLYGSNYGYTIVENQTLFLLESIHFRDPNFQFVKIAAAAILFSIIWALIKKRFSVKNFALAGFGLGLALMNVRSFPYLVFISLPAVLLNFGLPKANLWHKLLVWVTALLLFYESYYYLNGDYYKYTGNDVRPKLEFKESGKKAMDFVLANNLPQPIFNNFDIGSYITYRGWPEYKIFVDGRPGEYPKEFFQQVYIPMQSDPGKFEEVNKQYGFKTIIFSHTDQTPWAKTFLANIVKNPQWKTVYIDDFMIVLIKNELPSLQIIDLSKIEPSSYTFNSYIPYFRLAYFLAQTQNMSAAQKFAEKSFSLFPQSPAVNAIFGKQVPNHFLW